MTDLFLNPKVLDYSADKYQLILLTLRWARILKGRGTPEPMPVLVERALREIVENKVTAEEILANKPPVEAAPAEAPAIVSVAGEGKLVAGAAAVAVAVAENGEKKKSKKKKKKEE